MDNKEFIQQRWVKDEIIRRLNYCPNTGNLTWAVRGVEHFDERFAGTRVGQRWEKNGYKLSATGLKVNGQKFTVVNARLCWLAHTGDWPKNTIDHIDRDPYNNKWENLCDVTQAENNKNRGLYKGNVFTNIRYNRGSWRVTSRGKYVGGSVCLGKALRIRTKMSKVFLDNLAVRD